MAGNTRLRAWVRDIRDSDRGVAILMGDGLPILLEDVTNPEEALDLLSEPLERRIVATRLRYWADVLDAADGGAS